MTYDLGANLSIGTLLWVLKPDPILDVELDLAWNSEGGKEHR
jgi:hypothetical protein